jgi:hypothetical protein
MAGERDQESFTSLLSGAINDIRDLFRQEVKLARVEISQEVSNAKAAAIKLGSGAVVMLFAAILLLFALAYGLNAAFDMPTWVGFAIVGGLLAITGGVVLALARSNLKNVKPVPERTVQTMKENIEWVKRQTS